MILCRSGETYGSGWDDQPIQLDTIHFPNDTDEDVPIQDTVEETDIQPEIGETAIFPEIMEENLDVEAEITDKQRNLCHFLMAVYWNVKELRLWIINFWKIRTEDF